VIKKSLFSEVLQERGQGEESLTEGMDNLVFKYFFAKIFLFQKFLIFHPSFSQFSNSIKLL
jgi:hypothetical protein